MFLKLAYLPSKLRFLGKYLFSEHQISAGQLSADSSSTETLYCLNRNTENMSSISFRKYREEKKENNLLTLIIKMQILFARAIITSTSRAC